MRLVASAIAGIAMALVLFLVMSGLISGSNDATRRTNDQLSLDFIQLDLDEVENIRRRVPPPEPEEVVQPPTLTRLTMSPPSMESQPVPGMDILGLGALGVQLGSSIDLAKFGGELPIGGFSEDGDLYAILRVEPIYPATARRRRTEGWVDLEYTVLPNGSVIDAIVLRSRPSGTFDEVAVSAILKWRFKPRVIDGQPVSARVEQRHNFYILESGGILED